MTPSLIGRPVPLLSRRLRATLGLVALMVLTSVMSAASSCSGVTGPGAASPDSVHLAYGVRTPVQGMPLALTFDAVVSDSRCAEDVVCVWAGDLRVRVRVENVVAGAPQPSTQVLEFSTYNARVQSAFAYRFELVNASARGGGDLPPASSYWVALRVTALLD